MIAFIVSILIGITFGQFCQSPVCSREPRFNARVDNTPTTIICNDPVNQCLGCCRAYTISRGYSAATSYVTADPDGRCICCYQC